MHLVYVVEYPTKYCLALTQLTAGHIILYCCLVTFNLNVMFLKYKPWVLSRPGEKMSVIQKKTAIMARKAIPCKYYKSEVRLTMPPWLIDWLIHSFIYLYILYSYSNHIFNHLLSNTEENPTS